MALSRVRVRSGAELEFSLPALERLSVPASGLNCDLGADADYRAQLIGVMARRAVAAAGGG
jgi:aerobic carbon-monoxide dehydrogenase medium subunit